MNTRANFSMATKEALAHRSGYRCSFPACGSPTTGPSAETPAAVSNSGMACHIWAAGSGGSARRISTTMSREQLEDVSNGVWMCYRHGKLVDTDEDTFSVPMLETWKRISELRAKLSQESGRDVVLTPRHLSEIPLPAESLGLVSLGAENTIIGDALSRSCAELIWGQQLARAARDVLIELTRNALTHGKARTVTLNIEVNHIELIDDGAPFNSESLRAVNAGGGSLSLRALGEDHAATVVFRSSRASGLNTNRLTIVRNPGDVLLATPCSISIQHDSLQTLSEQIVALENCDTVYAILPKYTSLSDAFLIPAAIAHATPSGKKLVFVGERLSERVVQVLRGLSPGIEILNFDE